MKRVPIAVDRLDALLPRQRYLRRRLHKDRHARRRAPHPRRSARDARALAFSASKSRCCSRRSTMGSPRSATSTLCCAGLGFQLFDMRHSYWKRAAGARYGGPKGQLVFGDALYLRGQRNRSRAQLESFGSVLIDERRCVKRRAARNCCVPCRRLLYGYVDYAIELLRGASFDSCAPSSQAKSTTPLRSRDLHLVAPAGLSGPWLALAPLLPACIARCFRPSRAGRAAGVTSAMSINRQP